MQAAESKNRLIYLLLSLSLMALLFAATFDSPGRAFRKLGYCETKISEAIGGIVGWKWDPCIDIVPASLSPKGIPVSFHPTERVNGLRTARLTSDWDYCDDASGLVVRVPQDFQTDFASIPKYARFYVDPMGDNLEAAVVHDWLYTAGPGVANWDRYKADDVFRSILKESGVNFVKRNIMFGAVRLGANKAFRNQGQMKMRSEDWTSYEVDAPLDPIVERRKNCDGFTKGIVTR